MFSPQVYVERRRLLRERVRSGVILLPGNLDSAMNYPKNPYRFRQDSNFLYFFGLDCPGLLGIMDIDEGKDTLFGNDSGLEDQVWLGPQPPLSELARMAGVGHTKPTRDLPAKLIRALKDGRRVHILPQYRAHTIILLQQLLGLSADFVDRYTSSELIRAIVTLRSVKTPAEIEEMDRAADIAHQMHTLAMRMAKPGVSEQHIAGAIEGVALSQGYMASFPIILSQNGHILHNHNHSHPLTPGRLMLTDAGAETHMHYASDFTRTIPIGGRFSPEQRHIYSIAWQALEGALALCKPGVTFLSVHLQAARIITEGLKELGLMRGDTDEAVAQGAHALFFPHGLGHMLGLDVHDMEGLGEDHVGYDDTVQRIDQFGTAYLRLGRALQAGFTLTVEPGIYFIPPLLEQWQKEKINSSFIDYDRVQQHLGFGGIRLEESVLITPTGCRVLGRKRIPLTIAEVEAAMR